MWVVALFGMATKYAEALLAIKYRVLDERSEMCGGPMYYLKKGLNYRFLAGFFASVGSLTAFGTGNIVQAHSVASGMQAFFGLDPWISGVGLSILIGVALIGGIKSIAKISSYLVPAMAIFYFIGTMIIIIINIKLVPLAFYLIVKDAFTGSAPMGGFVGASVMLAIQYGASRGVFTNEAVYEGEEANATCLCGIELKDAMRLIAEALPSPSSDYALQVTYDFAGRLYVNGWVDETERGK